MTSYIYKNQANDVFFTLNESVTLSTPFFILEIQSKATNASKLMWLNTDLSVNPVRYNKYVITEVDPDDEDLEDQKVNLLEGMHNFYVWETAVEVLDLASATGVIESGQIRVVGDSASTPTIPVPNSKHVFK